MKWGAAYPLDYPSPPHRRSCVAGDDRLAHENDARRNWPGSGHEHHECVRPSPSRSRRYTWLGRKGRPVGEARRPWGFAPGGVSGAVPMALVSRAGMRPFGKTYMGSLPRRAVCQVAASGRDQTSVSSLIPAHRSSSATMSIATAPSSLRPLQSLAWRGSSLSGLRATKTWSKASSFSSAPTGMRPASPGGCWRRIPMVNSSSPALPSCTRLRRKGRSGRR
jgi:hypothetical protein